MVCLGLELGAAGWYAQINPQSYGGTPGFQILPRLDWSIDDITSMLYYVLFVFSIQLMTVNKNWQWPDSNHGSLVSEAATFYQPCHSHNNYNRCLTLLGFVFLKLVHRNVRHESASVTRWLDYVLRFWLILQWKLRYYYLQNLAKVGAKLCRKSN